MSTVSAAAQEAALQALEQALALARSRGETAPLGAALAGARTLLPALPPAFGPVLDGIAQRLESSAMFGEESCSFSPTDLHDALGTWIARARLRLAQAGAARA
jgi:hypothetical protein